MQPATKGARAEVKKVLSEVPEYLIEHILSDRVASRKLVEDWVESLPNNVQQRAERKVQEIRINDALDILKRKREKRAKSREETEKIIRTTDVKLSQPDLYDRIADIRVNNKDEPLTDPAFKKLYPRNMYPFLGIPKKYKRKRTLWGIELTVIIYSAQVIDNVLRTDSNGIAIVDEIMGITVIDEIKRKISVGTNVLTKDVVYEFIDIMNMTDDELRIYLMKMPLANQDYCWPRVNKRRGRTNEKD